MVEDYSGSSCLIESETYATAETVTDASSSFTVTTIADPLVDLTPYTVKKYSSSNIDHNILSTTLISPTWCYPAVTIQPTTLSGSYVVFSGSQTLTFTGFTTLEGCTDATFTY